MWQRSITMTGYSLRLASRCDLDNSPRIMSSPGPNLNIASILGAFNAEANFTRDELPRYPSVLYQLGDMRDVSRLQYPIRLFINITSSSSAPTIIKPRYDREGGIPTIKEDLRPPVFYYSQSFGLPGRRRTESFFVSLVSALIFPSYELGGTDERA
ncbi:hypothetical protein LX32DRAFT_403350 [Colletotrichum zoysiae]|uniref:Uncharacterized protein n=1 Tax=Colletotrichum zoysiae TaxID=1216348 RepID=A0AAD9HHR0_9PEZI|nr:hypothetical protein LX32DRAFT_403350 [Colletotrichum zoysiae]